MQGQVAKHLFDVATYHRMGKAGIFSEDDRVELLDGEINEMSPIGSRHAGCVNALTGMLARRLGTRAVVSVQNPVVLSRHSEPQPDLAVLRPRKDAYRQQHPEPADVLAILEVIETSGEYDRGPKLRAYAEAGVPEVWLVDLVNEVIEVCREPAARAYRLVERLGRGQRVSLAAFPRVLLRVSDILG